MRPARRPKDWVAPGPSPQADGTGDAPGLDEDLCYLLGDWRIFQRQRGHRWSLDDLVTAWLAGRVVTGKTVPTRVLDLGTGIGSVLLMTAWQFEQAQLVGVEAQPVSAELARRSVRYNGAQGRCTVIQGDFRDADLVPAGPFDLVTGTPPYFPPGTASTSSAVQKDPCRVERRGGVEDYARVAASRVAPGGAVVLCHAALQRDRLLAAAAAADLLPTHVLDVIGREGKAPLITVGAFCRGPEVPGSATVSRLAVRGPDGQWTPEFRALRRDMGMPDRPPGSP